MFIYIQNVKVGGPGHTVEIDETLVAKRKYNRGHLVKEQWVFGGYDVEDKVGFLVAVPKRDKKTLESVIKNYILPGTTVVSDMWRAYNGIPHISNYEFRHLTVNHKEHFTDPITGATTNHIEAMWSAFKRRRITNFGRNRDLLNSHLCKFMWRQRYAFRYKNGVRKSSAFHNFVLLLNAKFTLEGDV